MLADRVVKRQSPVVARCERDRSEWGQRVGRESALFCVPDVRSYDDARGEIVFERIENAELLDQMLRANAPPEGLMSRAGSALAAIHSAARPATEQADADEVALHGDFGCGNLYYCRAKDKLWILDWSPGYWLGLPVDARFGSSSIDLATFLVSLFYHRPMASNAISRPESLALSFLQGYAAGRQGGFALATLRAELPGIVRRWEASRVPLAGWLRVALYHGSLRQLCRFVKRVELGG